MTQQIGTVLEATAFATAKHAGQIRKHTGEPYILHCMRVAKLCADAYLPIPVICAALLHDTIEDTNTTHQEIELAFGVMVRDLVGALTDTPKAFGNRATRKQHDHDRIIKGGMYVQSIKCADIIDNLPSIAAYDPTFGKTFCAEVELLLPRMGLADGRLLELAEKSLQDAQTELIQGALRDAAQK